MRSILLTIACFTLHAPASATQDPGRDAWSYLSSTSEAHKIMKTRCLAEAREEFFASAENVTAIFLENPEAWSFIAGSPDFYGISYTNPSYAYLHNGLLAIEFNSSAKHIPPSDKNPRHLPFARFDTKTRSISFVGSLSAPVTIRYTVTTSKDEEALGVHGRLIEIIERRNSRLLARRRDFIWINPDSRRSHGGFMCPTPSAGESVPISFVGKAINVQSYKCWQQHEQALKSNTNWRRINRSRLTDTLNECDALYFEQLAPKKLRGARTP